MNARQVSAVTLAGRTSVKQRSRGLCAEPSVEVTTVLSDLSSHRTPTPFSARKLGLLGHSQKPTHKAHKGAGIACWLKRRTRELKVASSNPDRSGGRIFFARVNFVCLHLFAVRSIPVLPQWHVKDPGHCAKSAGGRLHLNTHTPLTQRRRGGGGADYAAVQA